MPSDAETLIFSAMSVPPVQDRYPHSKAFMGLPPLRLPSGWTVSINNLHEDFDVEARQIGGASLFIAWNEGRRFRIEAVFQPEFDPEGVFVLTVTYQPWQRADGGRRRNDLPIVFGPDEQIVHVLETRSYRELIAELEHWIARCTVWTLEGS